MVESVCLLRLAVVVVAAAGNVHWLVTDMTTVVLVNVRFVGVLSCMVQTACCVMLVVRRLL